MKWDTYILSRVVITFTTWYWTYVFRNSSVSHDKGVPGTDLHYSPYNYRPIVNKINLPALVWKCQYWLAHWDSYSTGIEHSWCGCYYSSVMSIYHWFHISGQGYFTRFHHYDHHYWQHTQNMYITSNSKLERCWTSDHLVKLKRWSW